MTLEDWNKYGETILAEADKWNKFRESAQWVLLTNIGPRIAKLGRRMYMGCGFHYGMEQTFGKLVNVLALPWQPCGNHCAKIENDQIGTMITKILYCDLLKQVNKAERSAEWNQLRELHCTKGTV